MMKVTYSELALGAARPYSQFFRDARRRLLRHPSGATVT